MSLHEKLAIQERRLRAMLDESRATYQHMGNRGSYLENAVREFLGVSLPKKFSIGTGEIIDLSGERSAQADVIIANEDQPFLYSAHDPGLYIAEGVSAVGEVKARLNSGQLDDVLRKGASLKKLEASTSGLDLTGVPDSEVHRFFSCPPFFLIAFESDISIESLNQKVFDSLPFSPDGWRTSRAPVDAIFILGEGYGVDYGDGDGRFRFSFNFVLSEGSRIPMPGLEVVRDWWWRSSENVLTGMLLWISAVTARKHNGTVPSFRYFAREEEEARIREFDQLVGDNPKPYVGYMQHISRDRPGDLDPFDF